MSKNNSPRATVEDMVCANCANKNDADVGGIKVCICKRTNAYIGAELAKTHWCRNWEKEE